MTKTHIGIFPSLLSIVSISTAQAYNETPFKENIVAELAYLHQVDFFPAAVPDFELLHVSLDILCDAAAVLLRGAKAT